MNSNHSQEAISSIKGDPGFNLGNPDKMIQGYRLYDLRHCSEIDIMFICAHKGKDFNPSRIDQFLSMLADDFGYNGIIDQKGEIYLSHLKKEIKESSHILKSNRTLFDTKAGKIEDFGEKIGRAKKDRYAYLRENTIRFTSEELLKSPTSKTLPSINYLELVNDAVASIQEVTYLKYLRDQIGKKPAPNGTRFMKQLWLEQVERYRSFLGLLLNQEHPGIYEKEKLNLMQVTNPTRWQAFNKYSKIMIGLGFPKEDINLNGYEINYFHDVQYYAITKKYLIVKDKFETLEDAIEALSQMLHDKKKSIKFSIFEDRLSKKFFIGKKLKTNYIRLVDDFTTVKDAIEYLRSNQKHLESLYQQQKVIIQERPDENRERVGLDHLKGQNVTPEMFSDTFGFRGVEFGNWVNDNERQQSLNQSYNALMDLSLVTNISPKALSLGGKLALAFGSRGSGNASAHFESDLVVINLTKTKGAGSLAHEWWHALDNYFSRADGLSLSHLTENIATKKTFSNGNIREEMYKAFYHVTNTLKNLDIKERSKRLDHISNKTYWATLPELSARAFECWVMEKLEMNGIQNDYLVNFKQTNEWTANDRLSHSNYPYPLKNEFPDIHKAFNSFFDAIKEKNENEKQVLYRRVRDEFEYKNLSQDDIQLINTMSKALGVDISILQNREETQHLKINNRESRFAGCYDPIQDKIYIVLDEIKDRADLQATILHEALAHKGLRALFKEEFVPQLKKIWKQIPDIEKIGLLKQNNYNWIQSTEEYMAQLAEHYTDPTRVEKVKAVFKEFFRRVLKIELAITNDDLKYILYKAKRTLKKSKQNISTNDKPADEPSSDTKKRRKRIKR